MKRILYISHEGDTYGGSTMSLINMIGALEGDIQAWVVIPQNGKVETLFQEKGINYIVVPYRINYTHRKGLTRIITYLPRLFVDFFINRRSVNKISCYFKNLSIDVVHSNSSVVGIGQWVAKNLEAKFVWHIREYLDLHFGYTPTIGWPKFIRKIKKADMIFCVSHGIKAHYKLDAIPQAQVVYNAVMKKNGGMDRLVGKGNYFIFVGNVSKNKGIEDAFHAFAKISYQNPTFRLKIAGRVREEYFQELKLLAEELEVIDKIDFLGFTIDLTHLMNQANALLMCSKNEAFGRVTVEAMFNSCVVIGYNNAGTKELISDKGVGLLYDDVVGLANKMKWVIENPMEAERIEKSARLFAQERFSEEVVREKISNLYNSL